MHTCTRAHIYICMGLKSSIIYNLHMNIFFIYLTAKISDVYLQIQIIDILFSLVPLFIIAVCIVLPANLSIPTLEDKCTYTHVRIHTYIHARVYTRAYVCLCFLYLNSCVYLASSSIKMIRIVIIANRNVNLITIARKVNY